MPIAPEEFRKLGNATLLELPKTAFFCSRQYPDTVEPLTYLWALEQRAQGLCVLSGFHSMLEQKVFRYLLQGPQQPIIYALGRGIQPNLRMEYGPEIEAGRLLFITPFEPNESTVTQDTADIRNLLIADLADQFFIPYISPQGNLMRLLDTLQLQHQHKPILTLDIPQNQALLERGAAPFHSSGILGLHGLPL
ncbi:DNA-binding protein [Hymenobacter metallicola]|uniref:DNA-binding protein n=1 Tax=Hymenobacter metallicola TaxID=2563114 RepID=A0A4Z0QFJ7_9BACT|nr:DNA-binding protein [Hymenobacter metallicola]TGE27472.1 DNA-binding protein [Hymenobacter metallicola]